MIQLILGGARSGKSSYAEVLAAALTDQVIYIATAGEDDAEMEQRIAHHQSNRPKHWSLIEEKFLLSQVLEKIMVDEKQTRTPSSQVILIDCLTLWLSNWLCRLDGETNNLNDWNTEKISFIEQLKNSPIPIILVSNEVGSGIVPMGELSRQFVDQAGWLNQATASVAERVTLVVAGLPLTIKDNSKKLSTVVGCY